MPLQKLQLRPGVNRESTTYSNEGGFFESDKIRFRSGYPEKIGGWTNLATSTGGVVNTYNGVSRNMTNWVTLNYSNLNAVGTNQKFYIENGGLYHDVTPQTTIQTGLSNPFASSAGSKLITVTDTAHGASVGTWVTLTSTATVGGVTVSGYFEIVSVLNGNTYTIVYAGSPTSITTDAAGGGTVTAHYDIAAGSATYTTSNGWGAGPWNGAYGWGDASATANSIGTQLRLWSADTFGQDLVFAARGGAIYYWAVDTSAYPRAVTLTSLATAANATTGPYVPTTTLSLISSDVQRFVIAFGSNPYTPGDPATTFDPMLVRWSDQEDAYTWVPAATNQSGEYKLAGGSTIITARTAKQEILIWTDAALFTMQYLGPPYVWGFNLLMDNISLISPNAISSANNQTFWMGVDKFYSYTGRVDTIPCTLRQYVFNDINQAQAYQIVSGTNEGFNEVWWFYPSANSPVNNRYVIYNHLEKSWYYGSINRTAWLDSPIRSFPMGAQSVQNSFLAVAITSTTATSLTLLNGYSYPDSGTLVIDSEYISYTAHDSADGNTLTGCVRGAVNPVTGTATTAATHVQYSAVTYLTPNQVMYHENGTDDLSGVTPTAIYSYVQSSDFDIGDGHNFGFVWRMLPDVTFDGSNVPAPKVKLSVRPRQNSGSNYGVANTPEVISANNYSPLIHNYVIQLFTGQVYTRIRGRMMAFKIESTDLGVAWQLGATRIDVRPDGRR
jgi:hypothetical protein